MKIIEVRDGFIKFEADENVFISSFIQADGVEKKYIAQVNQIKKIGEVTIAAAKILFILIDGMLHNYDKTLPSKDALIQPFTLDILQNSINAKKPVIIGKLLDNSGNIVIDASAFNKKMLISVDNPEINNILTRNLIIQFANAGIKTIVLDTQGIIDTEKKKAGIDFKLPLNTETLKFMYQSCLNDATEDSKSIIVDIFKDLSEYSKTVPFVPFGTLKAIVDDMVDNQHILKLFVLKNKLAKFEKLGYFADKKSDADKFLKILESDYAVIDFSELDSVFKNCYLEYVYSVLEGRNDIQVLAEMSNSVTKKNLKLVISDSSVPAAIITNSKYPYLNDIKNMFDNFIIEPTLTNNEMFKVYGSFFGSMEKGMYLIAGEAVNYIPVVSYAKDIDEVIKYTYEETQDTEPGADIIETEIDTEPEPEQNSEPEDTENDIEEPVDTAAYHDRDEIIATIDEKSDNVINSVSQSLDEEPQDIELFSDEEDSSDEVEEDVIESLEDTEEDEEIKEYDELPSESENDLEGEEEDVIEPEFKVTDEEISLNEDTDDSLGFEDDSSELAEINDTEDNLILEEVSDTTEFSEDDASNDDEYPSQDIKDESLDISGVLLEESDDNVQALNDESDILQTETDDMLPESTEDDELSVALESNEEDLIQELQMSDSQQEEINLDAEREDTSDILQVSQLEEDDGLEEIAELDPDSVDDNDIVIDITDDADNINIDEDLDRQIVEDVDKVYTTMKEIDEEEISDSDLDFIDELNSDNEDDSLDGFTEELQEISDSGIEDGILDQPKESIIPQRQSGSDGGDEILEKREANTPIVPVYDADIPQEDMVVSDPIQQGDSVVHAKYGNGVVEKMIKYGTKTLFSINFENIGRRLLDPTLTEIKKL